MRTGIKNTLIGIGIFAVLVVIWIMYAGKLSGDQQQIQKKVSAEHGVLTSIHRVYFHTPFPWYEHTKGSVAFRFTYQEKGKKHTGWALFRPLYKTRWDMPSN